MPRDLVDPDFEALIASGHYESHTAVVITLGNSSVLRFGTTGNVISGQTFLAALGESEPLRMTLTAESDSQGLKAQNIDNLLGQQIAAAANALEGATAVLGMMFQDQDRLGPVYYDEKMPGDLMTGGIDAQWVALSFVNDIDAGFFAGETIASAFPYQDPTPIERRLDPSDLIPPGGGGIGGGGLGDNDPLPRNGRLPIVDMPGGIF